MFYLVFILGLVFGSFLNVVIYRLSKRAAKNIIFGRSFCPNCRIQLKWHDLVPVLSFFWLRGLCRYCHKKISWQYPIVEILSGFIWVAVFYKVFGFSDLKFEIWNFTYYIFVLSSLLIVAVYDAKRFIIPNKVVYPAIVIALIYNFFSAFKLGNSRVLVEPFFVALVAFLFFFMIFYFSFGKAMGLGDAKLAFLVGLFLNPLSAVIAFTITFIIGAVFGIILIGLGKKTFKSQIAFGPFLVIGAITAFFLSDLILKFIVF